MSSWSDFDSLNFWESSWIMRYVSPYSAGGGGNADGSISVASSSGSRHIKRSGQKSGSGNSVLMWRIGKPREPVPDEYETGLINALIKDPTNQELMKEFVAAGGHISEELGPLSPYNLSGEERMLLSFSSSLMGRPLGFPDATSVEINLKAEAGVSTNTAPIGVLIKNNPTISGSNVMTYVSGGTGVGTIDASATVKVTSFYIVGPNADKVRMRDFSGWFASGSVGGKVIGGVTLGVSVSNPTPGAVIIGFSVDAGVGLSLTGVSGDLSGNIMEYYGNL